GVEPEPLSILPLLARPEVFSGSVADIFELAFEYLVEGVLFDEVAVFVEILDPHPEEVRVEVSHVVPSTDDPFSRVSAFDRRKEGVLSPDLLTTLFGQCVLFHDDVIEDSDVTVHTCDPGRQTRREDRGIADRFSFPDRVIDGDFRGSPLLPLTLVRVDHLRPVPGVNLARQDILDEAELDR